MTKLKDLCQGKWHGLLTSFGVDSRVLDGSHQPCPLCPGNAGKDRFRFDNKQGNGTYFCSQCGSGDGVSFLMKFKGWEFKQAAHELEKIVGEVKPSAPAAPVDIGRKRLEMQRRWNEGSDVCRDDPVGEYLASRFIIPDYYGISIRHHPGIRNSNGTVYPAMLAIFQGPDGVASQLETHYLTSTGQKAPVQPQKEFLSGLKFAEGGAVRLGGMAEAIGIAEGVTTAMSASILFGLPVWAALSCANLAKFIPPESVKEVYVFGDNDLNYVGQAHAYALARRLHAQRSDISTHVSIPEKAGFDWNDVLTLQMSKNVA